MTTETWLAELAGELRRRGVEPAALVAEAAAHLRDCGQPPLTVFGSPATYAAAVAASLAPTTELRVPPPGPIRLTASKITKRYGRKTILDGVDLSVRGG